MAGLAALPGVVSERRRLRAVLVVKNLHFRLAEAVVLVVLPAMVVQAEIAMTHKTALLAVVVVAMVAQRVATILERLLARAVPETLEAAMVVLVAHQQPHSLVRPVVPEPTVSEVMRGQAVAVAVLVA